MLHVGVNSIEKICYFQSKHLYNCSAWQVKIYLKKKKAWGCLQLSPKPGELIPFIPGNMAGASIRILVLHHLRSSPGTGISMWPKCQILVPNPAQLKTAPGITRYTVPPSPPPPGLYTSLSLMERIFFSSSIKGAGSGFLTFKVAGECHKALQHSNIPRIAFDNYLNIDAIFGDFWTISVEDH